jgi:competence/damage-inducible protein CinA-like protein
MPSAEILTIGTEILLGEIVDTNASYLARSLRDAGVDVYRKTTVGDNPHRIAQAIQESLSRCDLLITTGGLGPTVDDPTREAVALAVGVETEYRAELWEQIQARFRRFRRQPTENNKRQAFIPRGAEAVENPVGTAPAFIVAAGKGIIFSLPGVPHEMEYLMQHAVIPYLKQRFDLHGVIKSRVLHTAGVGESQIDDQIEDLERLSNPTVGLAAHAGQVDVRITVKAESEELAKEMIWEVEEKVRRRLGDWIYGADEDKLETAAIRALETKGWALAVVEAGLDGELIRRLAAVHSSFRGGEIIAGTPGLEELTVITEEYCRSRNAEVGLGVALHPGIEKTEIFVALITPQGNEQYARPYGGPPQNAPRWAVHHSLDVLRRLKA